MADKKVSQFAIAADLDDAVLAGYVTGDTTNNWQFTISLFDSRYYQQGAGFAASATTSGTFDDARISESSVTQHVGSLSHSNLLPSSLDNDDHTQYHNDARGDSRYYTQTQVDALTWAADDIVSGTFADARISESSVTQHESAIDHDALTNFVANEHIDWTSTTANLSTSGTAATGALGVTGNITVTGTVDGRDLATDGVKLDLIEDEATADQTGAEIEGLLDTQFGSSLYRQWWAGPYGVDVLDDGTVAGDGTTDDATAINAIATAAGEGAVLNFRKPTATYAVEAPLVPLAKQTWQTVGSGWDQVAIKGVSSPAALIQPNPLYSSTGKQGIAIRGFRLEGTCTHAVDMRATTSAVLESLRPSFGTGCTGDIIHMEYAWGSIVNDIRCYSTGGTAALRLSSACHGVVVSNFHTEAETDYGIVIDQAASLEIPNGVVIIAPKLQRHHEAALWFKAARNCVALGVHSELSRVPLRFGDEAGGVINRAASCSVIGLFETGMYTTTYYTANDTGAVEAYNCIGCKLDGIQSMSVYTGSGNANTLVLLKDAQNLEISGFSRNNMTLEEFTGFIKKHASAETDNSVWITGSGPYKKVIPDGGGANLHYIESVTAGVRSLEEWTPATVA